MPGEHRIGVWGASGSGKTTRAIELVKGLRRVVVFDPMIDSAWGKGWVQVGSERALREQLRKRWGRGFRLRYTPATTGNAPEELHRVCRVLIQAQEPFAQGADRRGLTLVVDELNLSFPNQSLPRGIDGFMDMCSRGRHYGINVIGISQRIAEVNTRFRGNTTSFYAFRVADHVDAQTVSRMMPDPAMGRELLTFPNFEYYFVSQGSASRGKTRRK